MSTPCNFGFTRQTPSEVSIAGPRPQRRHRGRPARTAGWRGPASVWLCRSVDHRDDPGVISGWLRAAITTIVTVYSLRGDRVLLVGPSEDHPANGSPVDAVRTRHERGLLAGLADAAPAVAGLGRDVHSQTGLGSGAIPAGFGAAPTQCRTHAGSGPGSESGSGPRPGQPDPIASDPKPASDRGDDQTDPCPSRYDLIITTVAADTAHTTDLAAQMDRLHPSGTLTVLTHSDTSSGRLLDPTGPIVRAADRVGLRFRDHIALVNAALRHPGARDSATAPQPEHAAAPSNLPGHADLLVFDLAPAAFTPHRRTGDLR